MPPSNNYPITKAICSSFSPPNSKNALPMLLPTTALASLDQPIDPYLNKVIRHLKEPFEIVLELKFEVEVGFCIRFHPALGIPDLAWVITIQQMIKRQNLTSLQALGMLNQGLFQYQYLLKNVMHSIKQLGDDPKAEILAPEIEKLRILKRHLLNFTGLLDDILMYYSGGMNGSSNQPKLTDVGKFAKKLRKSLNNLNPERLHNLIPNVLMREEHILCSVLGLQDKVADRLVELDPEMRSHQNDKYFLLCFLQEECEYLSESLTDTTAMKEKLQEIGFTENRSVVVADWISKQRFQKHQSVFAWVHDYITNLFNYDIFLNDCVPKYPYSCGREIIDKWFSVPAERDKEEDSDEDGEEDGVVITNVKVINTTPDKVFNEVKKMKHEFLQQHPGEVLYFHGTDHKAAESILEDGINLGVGKRKCDFSSGLGFYLTYSTIDSPTSGSEFSIGWAKKNEACAIVIFHIAENCLNKYQCLDLSPNRRASDLKKVNNHFRDDERLPKTLRRSCNDGDYIKGPISQVDSPGQRHIQQMCIKKQKMADDIGDAPNIFGIIFINKK